jgi:hypothetical protein
MDPLDPESAAHATLCRWLEPFAGRSSEARFAAGSRPWRDLE